MGSFDGPEVRSLGERCIMSFGRNAGPPMFPNGFYNNNYQIVQTADAVVIQVEMNHDVRLIRLNGKHRTDDVRPYMGDSIGRYDGDTLVVETTHIPQSQHFMGSWKNLKITETFRRVGKSRLHYTFTIDDPDTWDKPWGGEYEFSPLDGVIYEYACHEGNYALPGILGGARAEEAEKAEAARKGPLRRRPNPTRRPPPRPPAKKSAPAKSARLSLPAPRPSSPIDPEDRVGAEARHRQRPGRDQRDHQILGRTSIARHIDARAAGERVVARAAREGIVAGPPSKLSAKAEPVSRLAPALPISATPCARAEPSTWIAAVPVTTAAAAVPAPITTRSTLTPAAQH